MPQLLSFDELRLHGVLYGRRWVDQLEEQGRFPRRVKIGSRRVGWVKDEIVAYVSATIAQRGPVPPVRIGRKRKRAG